MGLPARAIDRLHELHGDAFLINAICDLHMHKTKSKTYETLIGGRYFSNIGDILVALNAYIGEMFQTTIDIIRNIAYEAIIGLGEVPDFLESLLTLSKKLRKDPLKDDDKGMLQGFFDGLSKLWEYIDSLVFTSGLEISKKAIDNLRIPIAQTYSIVASILSYGVRILEKLFALFKYVGHLVKGIITIFVRGANAAANYFFQFGQILYESISFDAMRKKFLRGIVFLFSSVNDFIDLGQMAAGIGANYLQKLAEQIHGVFTELQNEVARSDKRVVDTIKDRMLQIPGVASIAGFIKKGFDAILSIFTFLKKCLTKILLTCGSFIEYGINRFATVFGIMTQKLYDTLIKPFFPVDQYQNILEEIETLKKNPKVKPEHVLEAEKLMNKHNGIILGAEHWKENKMEDAILYGEFQKHFDVIMQGADILTRGYYNEEVSNDEVNEYQLKRTGRSHDDTVNDTISLRKWMDNVKQKMEADIALISGRINLNDLHFAELRELKDKAPKQIDELSKINYVVENDEEYKTEKNKLENVLNSETSSYNAKYDILYAQQQKIYEKLIRQIESNEFDRIANLKKYSQYTIQKENDLKEEYKKQREEAFKDLTDKLENLKTVRDKDVQEQNKKYNTGLKNLKKDFIFKLFDKNIDDIEEEIENQKYYLFSIPNILRQRENVASTITFWVTFIITCIGMYYVDSIIASAREENNRTKIEDAMKNVIIDTRYDPLLLAQADMFSKKGVTDPEIQRGVKDGKLTPTLFKAFTAFQVDIVTDINRRNIGWNEPVWKTSDEELDRWIIYIQKSFSTVLDAKREREKSETVLSSAWNLFTWKSAPSKKASEMSAEEAFRSMLNIDYNQTIKLEEMMEWKNQAKYNKDDGTMIRNDVSRVMLAHSQLSDRIIQFNLEKQETVAQYAGFKAALHSLAQRFGLQPVPRESLVDPNYIYNLVSEGQVSMITQWAAIAKLYVAAAVLAVRLVFTFIIPLIRAFFIMAYHGDYEYGASIAVRASVENIAQVAVFLGQFVTTTKEIWEERLSSMTSFMNIAGWIVNFVSAYIPFFRIVQIAGRGLSALGSFFVNIVSSKKQTKTEEEEPIKVKKEKLVKSKCTLCKSRVAIVKEFGNPSKMYCGLGCAALAN